VLPLLPCTAVQPGTKLFTHVLLACADEGGLWTFGINNHGQLVGRASLQQWPVKSSLVFTCELVPS